MNFGLGKRRFPRVSLKIKTVFFHIAVIIGRYELGDESEFLLSQFPSLAILAMDHRLDFRRIRRA